MKVRYLGPLIDCAEVARLLRLKPRTIRGRNDRGAMPRPYISKPPFRWKQDEVEAWIEAGMPSRDEWEELKQGAGRSTHH